jgi:aryl-alcohol dehydrogenase-like predicted oxidoreductase
VILKAWGTWSLFQALLAVLRDVGDRHGGVSIANVAARWVLDHPFVGAVIIGARLGVSEHADDNQHIFEFTLTEEDQNAIEVVLTQSNGRRMISLIGDCGAEYR